MVKTKLPCYGLCFSTRETISQLSNQIGNNQAVEILKQAIITSLKQIRISEQLKFMRQCVKKNLSTQRIESSTANLGLRSCQRRKLEMTMLKNTVRQLHKDKSGREREKRECYKKARAILQGGHVKKFHDLLNSENAYSRHKTSQHFSERLQWIIKTTDARKPLLPDSIDNIQMKDTILPTEFESEPRVYGEASVNDCERKTLSLPPKFAVFKKVNTLNCKSEVQKAFTKLRWKRTLENSNRDATEENSVKSSADLPGFFDDETHEFDLGRQRATNLPFNKRVCMPPAVDEETEAKIQMAKVKLSKVAEKHAKKSKGRENVQDTVKNGIDSLLKRTEANNVVCYPTDKSGRMSIDSPENYIASMQPHIEDMITTDQAEYESVEKELNAHMASWCTILQGDDRVRNAYQATHSEMPPLYGLRKDHKLHADVEVGPPTRPVCGAVVSSNYRVSHFLSSILRPLIKQAPTVCESTEDMLSRIKECNEQCELGSSVVGSMDAIALYPSIDIEFSVSVCVQLIAESDMEFSSTDVDELGLFLCLTTPVGVLEEAGILKFCPRRMKSRGRPPTLRSTGTVRDCEKRWAHWFRSTEQPGISEIKHMVSFAIGVTLRYTMNNHIFKFNGTFFKQPKGGAIGVGVAGDVATLFMVWYDRTLLQRLKECKIDMQLYARYVDDINIAAKKTSGCDNSEPADKMTMLEIQQVANTIHPSLQVTVDYPSNHASGRMPVLDIEQWIQPVDVNGSMKHQILHSHYMKPMSSKHVVNKSSALPISAKMNILIADLVRVMRNVSNYCQESERTKHIQQYIHRMQFSGYTCCSV